MARGERSGSRVDTVVVIGCVFLALIARGLPDRLREPIALTMRRTIVAPLVALQKAAEVRRSALLSYGERTAARDSMALRAMAVTALEGENERLRKLLGLGQQLRWGFVPAEALHSRSLGEEFTVTLTAGSKAGVKAFSPVIAPEGLVGMVHTVDPTMSLAILWAHPDFRVSAMAADGSAFGIAAAHLAGGPERYLLELRGVPFRSTLKAGTMIVSSGLGGVYPRGIPIGTVLSELRTPEGWARTYLVRPAVLPPDVTSVMVLAPERSASGVASVWALSTAAADSAARGVASGSDSVARSAALAEVAARRAVLDSVRRDSIRRSIPRRPTPAPVTQPAPAPPVEVPPARTDTAAPSDSLRRAPDTPAARPDSPVVRPDTSAAALPGARR